jgi:hypothetical protein
LLLLVSAGELERFGHSDRLVSGQQRTEAGMHSRNQHQRPVVGDLRQAEPAVIRWDLHAEATQFGKTFHILVRNLGVALDDASVDGVQKFPQLGQEIPSLRGLVVRGHRERVDEVERKAT